MERGYRCEVCGAEMKHGLELHHVLPYADFPEYQTDKRNVLIVCSHCHSRIHNNPFLQAAMMRRKAEELGVNLKDVYDTSLEQNRKVK